MPLSVQNPVAVFRFVIEKEDWRHIHKYDDIGSRSVPRRSLTSLRYIEGQTQSAYIIISPGESLTFLDMCVEAPVL
jgi:hypothetical protein